VLLHATIALSEGTFVQRLGQGASRSARRGSNPGNVACKATRRATANGRMTDAPRPG
jgi:hypothetical protein